MNQENKIPDQLKGPPAYENWRACLSGHSTQTADEYPLYTDTHVTSDEPCITYGPYQFLNNVFLSSPKQELRPAIILRVEIHLDYNPNLPPNLGKTDSALFHGGSLSDEIAALGSLALGIRLKAGGVSRTFNNSNLRGMPVGWDPKPEPVLLKVDQQILPTAIGTHCLEDIKPITLLPSLSRDAAIALIRAARLYQDAVWIAESEPALSWVMLVSAAEAAAEYWRSEEEAPLDTLKISQPKLLALLEKTGIEDLPSRVADHLTVLLGSTRRFRDFLLEFMPPPPPKRPPEWAQHSWDTTALKQTLTRIYGYRSKALHSGKPFPAPMCYPPLSKSEWEAPAEKPTGFVVTTMGGTWVAEDIPMHLHTFAYIVRSALLKWWVASTKENEAMKSERST